QDPLEHLDLRTRNECTCNLLHCPGTLVIGSIPPRVQFIQLFLFHEHLRAAFHPQSSFQNSLILQRFDHIIDCCCARSEHLELLNEFLMQFAKWETKLSN